MSVLFDKDVRTINEHINNIYKEKELEKHSTIRKSRIVQKEGARKVFRDIEFYNLDVIISVSYRIKFQRGIEFRIWATKILKEHLLKGYTINQKRIKELKDKQLEEFKDAIGLIKKTVQTKQLSNYVAPWIRI
jgi:hypothetical protein